MAAKRAESASDSNAGGVEERRLLEEALRDSETQFRTLADTTSAAILLYGEDDRVNYVNPAAITICGFSGPELLQMTLWDLVHPDFHESIRARRLARARGEAVPARAQMRINTRDGSERWVDYTAGFAELGGRHVAIGTAFDITEQRRAQATTQRERDFSEAILNSLPGVFYLYDENLRFIRWNRNFETVLGYSGEEIALLSPLDLFASPDKERVAERIREVFARGVSSVEADFLTKSGGRIPFYFTGLTTYIDGRRCLIGTGIDITARKQAEQALLETQRRLEEAQERAGLGSWEIDTLSRRGYWSKEMYRLYERDPARGPASFSEFFELTHPDDHERVRTAYAECLATGQPTTIELRALTPSGRVRNLSGVVDCIQDGSGRVVRLAGTLLDVTERKRAEEENLRLEAALRRNEMMAAMGALVGGVAHEVRNPIFGMTATLDAVEARFVEQPELTRYFEVLRGELNRLSGLMRDLLEYGKPYTHELEPEAIGGVVEAAVAACAGAAQDAGIDVVTAGLPQAARVRMERGRLQQVFENLIRNAVQFAPRGSRVEVSVRETQCDDAPCVECVVADRGPGMAEEDLKTLFEPFFSRRRGGTGLGLSIVQRIVEEHRGTVAAANRPGGGAMMTVRLPMETA